MTSERLLYWIGLALSVLILVACSGVELRDATPSRQSGTSPDPASTRPAQPAFKGIELYSWQDEKGEWLFSILMGTNRIKSIEEIQATPLDIEAVKDRFCEMAIGEGVLWMDGIRDSGTEELLPFPTPPQRIVAELEEAAGLCQIHLSIQP